MNAHPDGFTPYRSSDASVFDLPDWEIAWLQSFDACLATGAFCPHQNLIPTRAAPTVLPDAPSAIIEEGKC